MYIPKHFEGDEATGREIMQAHGWALLITADEDGAPLCTHLALVWEDDGSPHGSLIGHMARANAALEAVRARRAVAGAVLGPARLCLADLVHAGRQGADLELRHRARLRPAADHRGHARACSTVLTKLAAQSTRATAPTPGASTACRPAMPRRRPRASSPSA